MQERARTYLFHISSKAGISLESRIGSLNSSISPQLGEDQPTLIGIQVRRGDKSHDKYIKYGWVVPDKSYFQHAMDYFRSKFNKVYFIVVSEDKKWAKMNIVGHDVIHSSSKYDLLEFTLLTLCDHTIMSVGTFSYWAAYLAGGEVVYYRNHIKPNSPLSKNYNDTQYFLPHWKPMI